ncbi:sugar phosphate isomerase/epimerase family protein [Haladaptatus sp. DFWS20]|uniref:sugar phosphate isomerase/epimerase family protein n=1 Tax=Haladaptatus sp. DFWS20 TaxID=3403467 RepID=UPI003EBAFEF3
MRFGLCTISAKESGVETVLSQAADAGYDGVEVWGGHVEPGETDPDSVRKTAASLGLAIPVYGSYLRPGTDGFEENLPIALDTADALGADLIRIWAGEQEYGNHDDAHWERVVSDLRTLTAAANDYDIGVTVEKHEGSLTNRTEGARRLIETIDDARCGLNWQPLFGMSPESIRREARELAPLSNNIHVQAVPERGGATRCSLAGAFFDVGECLAAFEAAGFSGFVNVEFVRDDAPYEDAVFDDLTYLSSL